MEMASTDDSRSQQAEVSMKAIVDDELNNLSKRAKRRMERIQLQKDKKKAKKAAARQEREKLMQENPRLVHPRARGPDPDPIIADQNRERNRAAKDKIRQSILDDANQGPIVVFDLSIEWELAMTVAERASLAQQFMYSYGSNKRCIKPARLLTTGLPEGGVVDRALHKHAGKSSWLAFDFSGRPLADHLGPMRKFGVSLETFEKCSDRVNTVEAISDLKGAEEVEIEFVEPAEVEGEEMKLCKNYDDFKALDTEADMYYLTADTENILDEVPWNNHTVYVIGAIVDRNRLTRAAVIKAEKLGIKPVALPLAKYCDIQATKVLTVNHTLEILQRRGCGESWESAFANTLPVRKDVTIKGKKVKQPDQEEREEVVEAATQKRMKVEKSDDFVKPEEEGEEEVTKPTDYSFSRDIKNL